MKIYTAGEVAELMGLPYHRLDYLERRGKIPRAQRTGTNQRIYTEFDLHELQKRLSAMGELPSGQNRPVIF